MKINKNPIWDFFKSIKLALFTFFTLAITSIAGTVIQQNEAPAVYVREYGASAARLFDILDITDMYNSWWFLGLLILFSINLIICSINRFPGTWQLIVLDNLAISIDRLKRMRPNITFSSKASMAAVVDHLESGMADAGWKPVKKVQEGETLFSAQKGAWTRLGVYMVHMSILVIFAGAIIGTLFGYKASIMLPAGGNGTDKVYLRGSNATKDLGFTIRCNDFSLSYYDTGAPKEYRSDISILENGKEVLRTPVIVNDPLTYNGITFYQSSYQGYDEFIITIKDQATEAARTFRVAPKRKVSWPQAGISFGIINYQPPNPWGQYQLKIWFSDSKGTPSQFLLDGSRDVVVNRPDASYLVSSKQFFATGLQISKDPGVWYVYLGCALMLLGLTIAFFLSHKRVWVRVSDEGGHASLLISGVSNKNKVGFEKDFVSLVTKLKQNDKLQLNEE